MICCLLFPFLQNISFPLFDGMTVTAVESVQALLLLFFGVFSFFYLRPLEMEDGKKQFWLWAVAWWLLLFGRSISWGRDYFPDIPKPYFRMISVLMIAPVVFMLFSPHLRAEIAHKFKTVHLSFWAVLLVVVGLVVSDAVEHSRYLAPFFLHDMMYKDLIEEVYEFPLIIGLFLVAYPIMQQDHVFDELHSLQFYKE
ncbi:hypothetical protein B9T33_03705 [Acinetobacter sp. ANC 5054]|nr:hypothetical protein B9T33_03705 [Acinetobacter sp. ANC 5054]